MTNVAYDSIEDYNCCYTVGDYRSMIANGEDPQKTLEYLRPRSRDNARTPYQWNASFNAGFTTGKPWIKVNTNYETVNLEADRASEDSVFAFYRQLCDLRKTQPAIIDGDLKFWLEDSDKVLVYTRTCARQTLLIIANKSDEELDVQLPEELKGHQWKRLLSNRPETAPSLDGGRKWLPWETEIYTLEI